MMRDPNHWIAALSILLVVAALMAADPQSALGQGAGSGVATDGRMLFGGRIQMIKVCTCPVYAFLWLRVGPPIQRDIVLTWSSLQYLYYSYINSSWALGDAAPIMVQCLDICKKGCCNSGFQGFPVIHIGTSLPSGG